MEWYDLPEPQVSWLVEGLFPADSPSLVVGKPKTGKSSLVRNLIACVIKGHKFLDRSIDIPAGTGRVLYIHLDPKDPPHIIAKELRQLGITEKEKGRMALRIGEEMPASYQERLQWLKEEVTTVTPHLIVIDLMWDFANIVNVNDYIETRNAMNSLQHALKEANYRGAVVATAHSRKATNPEDPADNICGSTAQRGSFSTIVMLARNRKQGAYTIMSEQTQRDPSYGEIEETIIGRKPDGTIQVGSRIAEVLKEQKKTKREEALDRLHLYLADHPGCEMKNIVSGITMAKPKILTLVKESGIIVTTGGGVKGDPFKYFVNGFEPRDAGADKKALPTETTGAQGGGGV